MYPLAALEREPDDTDAAHARKVIERGLDVAGVDVFSLASDDDLLDPPAYSQPAPLIDLADISGSEPSVVDGGRLRPEVAGRHVRPAHQDFIAGPQLHLLHRQGAADAAGAPVERVRHRHDRGCLGQPVPLDDEIAAAAEERVDRLGKRRPPRDDQPEPPAEQPLHAPVQHRLQIKRPTRETFLAPLERLEPTGLGERAPHLRAQEVEQPRHGEQTPGLEAPRRLHHFARPRRDEHDGQTHGEGQKDADRLAEHVRQRQRGEEAQAAGGADQALPAAVGTLDRSEIGEQVPVRQDHALGIAGRSRGEDHLGTSVEAGRRRRVRHRRSVRP